MAISKTKNYLVLNHSASPVGVSTKYDSFLINGGTEDSPGSLPLSFDEIAVINSRSPVFKVGVLRFDPAVEAELYEALSIFNWREIMTRKQIADALLNPTMEVLQEILAIENEVYFDRIRGEMISLRNSGADISARVERIIEQRREELAKHRRKTAIRLAPREQEKPNHTQEEFDSMKNELAELKAMMAQMLNASSGETAETKKKAEAKPKTSVNQKTKETQQ